MLLLLKSKYAHILSIFLTLVFVVLPITLVAAPSAELPVSISQPDGSKFIAVTIGDEWNSHVETAAGYTIDKDASGLWRYVESYSNGVAKLANIPADKSPPLNLKKHLRNYKKNIYTPTKKNLEKQLEASPLGNFSGPVLFILTQFSNQSGSTTESAWATFVTNYLGEFYNKTSHGRVTLTPAYEWSGTANNGVVNWVTLGYNHPNTGANTGTANQQLTKDAILAADPYVDFAAYDTNSDGYVDANELAVVVIAAGYETSYGGAASASTPNLWGHKWSIGNISPPVVDGKTVGSYHSGAGGYAQFGELHATGAPPTNSHQATLGIMAHELGHLIFGLPDLYDTDSSSSGVGAFCLMSGGSWGQASTDTWSGQTPVLASAWIRYNRGWVDNVTGSGNTYITAAGAASASSTNTVYRSSTGLSNEYFLVENRQPQGYDRGLQRYLGTSFGGLAIWHVDDTQTNNENDTHRWVDLEEADNTQMGTTKGEATDLWYAGNAVTFNDTSSPDSKRYDGAASSVDISSISASATEMTANFGATIPCSSSTTPINVGGTGSGELAATDCISPVRTGSYYDNFTFSATAGIAYTITLNSSAFDSYLYLLNSSGQVLAENDDINPGIDINSKIEYTPTSSETLTIHATSYSVATGAYTVTLNLASTIPAAPSNLNATAASSSQINLSWSDNSSNETGFKIERKTSSDGTWSEIAEVGVNATSYSDMLLTADTTYVYRVRATNSSGNSDYSNEASATTSGSVPAAPSNLIAAVVSSSQINLSWSDNSSNETGFKIERKTGSDGTWSEIALVGANAAGYSDMLLTADTTYVYRVRATNSTGNSDYSNEASATTSGTLPAAPSNLNAAVVSSSQINLSWSDNSSNETGFKIERKTGADGTWSEIALVGANATGYSDMLLTADTTYVYRVRATNSSGNSDYSNESSATTSGTLPTAPSNLNAAVVSSSQINLSWSDNSSNETGFKIERKTGSDGIWSEIALVGVNATGYSDMLLTADTTYVYRVRATNSSGNSDYSNEVSATTSGTIPSAPSNLNAAVVSSSQINLSWSDNSSNEIGFKIDRKTGSDGIWSEIALVGANATGYSDMLLTADTTYVYRVRATNSSGNSDYSNEASATTSGTLPTAPSNLNAAVVSSSQINLSWSDNSSNEIGFKIERKTGADGIWSEIALVGVNATGYSDMLLTADTTYVYRVRATNSSGNSDYSNEVSATTFGTLPTLPGAPSNLSAAVAFSTQIDLNWIDNSDNETGFKIERKTKAAKKWTQIATVDADVTNYSSTGKPRSNYVYRVCAANAVGDSDYSNEVNITLSKPKKPTRLKTAALSSAEIDLSWWDNSNNEEMFIIERKTGKEAWMPIDTLEADSTSYSDTAVTPSTRYFYRVRAFNILGNSPYSNRARGITPFD